MDPGESIYVPDPSSCISYTQALWGVRLQLSTCHLLLVIILLPSPGDPNQFPIAGKQIQFIVGI